MWLSVRMSFLDVKRCESVEQGEIDVNFNVTWRGFGLEVDGWRGKGELRFGRGYSRL